MQLNRSIKLRANRVREIFTPIVIRAISFRGREPHRGFLQRWCHRGWKSYASFNNERANYQRYNASHQSVAAVTTCRSIDLASPKTGQTGACFFSSLVFEISKSDRERRGMTEERSAIPFHRTKWRTKFAAHVPPTRQGIESASKRVEAVAITVVPRLPLGFQASSGTPRFRYTWHRATREPAVSCARS